MENNKEPISKEKKLNRTFIKSIIFVNAFILLGYLGQFKDQGRNKISLIIVSFLIISTTAVDIILAKKSDNPKNKYYIMILYIISYLSILLTSKENITYVYIFPILAQTFLYFDLKFTKLSTILTGACTIIQIFYFAIILGQTDGTSYTHYSIQLIITLVICGCTYTSTKVSNELNKSNLNSLEIASTKQKEILTDVLNTAKVVDDNSNKVFNIVSELEDSSTSISEAISNISQGMETSVNSIQTQTELTEGIQNIISDTAKVVNSVDSISSDTTANMEKGVSIVNELNNKTIMVNKSSDKVYESMMELQKGAKEINSMTDTISSITEQTNMLSLNASIESARAGEVGKGFAVVADEIRNLATQSGESANNISSIVNKLQELVSTCVDDMNELRNVNNEQNILISDTQKIFNETIEKMDDVNQNIKTVTTKVSDLLSANDKIVSSIQDISAVSEETMAAIEETSAITTENNNRAQESKLLTKELLDSANTMKKYV